MPPSFQDDLPILVDDALSKNYPFFLGYNFFEHGDLACSGEDFWLQLCLKNLWLQRFSVRYDKGGSEKKFGMFGYGNLAIKIFEQLGINLGWACQLSQISLPSLM